MESGTRFGPYEIIEQLGAGGMGEVYRARDANLQRDVAIKVLHAELVGDPERAARFQREARLLASLNHPRIAAIYGVEASDDSTGLVLELVEGETLAARIERGPVPLDEAIEIALQLADGMEFAHEQGIVHRDLKPANVSLGEAPEGGVGVKVLDFGLALALSPDPSKSGSGGFSSQDSPTMSIAATQAGMVLGTAAYMSPEQAKGKSVDRRADIWAFGVVVVEMLTGQRLFSGETPSEVMAAVIMQEPDLDALPAGTPPALVRLVARCLRKDPRQRLRDMGEARVLLQEILSGAAEGEAAGARSTEGAASGFPTPVLVVAVLAALGLGALGAWQLRPAVEPQPLRRFELPAPFTGAGFPAGAVISPNGQYIAYVAGNNLWVQDLSERQPRSMGQSAMRPFWSPDSRWIGYAEGNVVYRIAIEGGAPEQLAAGPETWSNAAGGVWMPDGRIIFTTGNTGLLEIPPGGGDVRPWLDPAEGEADFHNVAALPDGSGVVFVVHGDEGMSLDVFDGTRRVRLLDRAGLAEPAYSATGHLLYADGDDLWAVAYTPGAEDLAGAPFRVATDAANPSTTAAGVLVFVRRPGSDEVRWTWLDPSGADAEPVGDPVTAAAGNAPEAAYAPAISPDGRTAAYAAGATPGESDIWLLDLGNGEHRRLTFARGPEGFPEWTRDGEYVAYQHFDFDESGRLVAPVIHLSSVDGLSTRALATGRSPTFAPDGQTMIFVAATRDNESENDSIMTLAFKDPAAEAEPLLAGAEPVPARRVISISPDGRALAFDRRVDGSTHLYVVPFPAGTPSIPVVERVVPIIFNYQWTPDSDGIIFSEQRGGLGGFARVDLALRDGIVVGPPNRVGDRADLAPRFDIAPDGRFLATRPIIDAAEGFGITVMQNWYSAYRDTDR